MLKKLFSILSLLLAFGASSQEFNCKVTVRHDKITGTGTDPQLFLNMQKAITDLVNTRRWTTDEFASTERIECNIFINLVSANVGGDPNTFSGTISIQASRPVYNTSYTSTIVNFVDKDLTFKYSPFNPLNFDDNRIVAVDAISSNLSAIVAYYCYIILGLDYDSFSPMGGTAIYKRAQNIVNNAPGGKGTGITGWNAMDNNKNRYWIVDQLLNQRFSEARNFWYIMHREGLDSMSVKPVDARSRILTNLRKLYNVNKENPSSILIQFLFNAKSDEIIKLVEMSPKNERTQYITMLSAMDVANAAKYNALK
jgi:hypothetical protein